MTSTGIWSYCNSVGTDARNELQWLNLSPPGQNGHHFTDDIFICISRNAEFCISNSTEVESLIQNKSALVQVMAWCRTGDKPLPEPMLSSSLTSIYVALGGRRGKTIVVPLMVARYCPISTWTPECWSGSLTQKFQCSQWNSSLYTQKQESNEIFNEQILLNTFTHLDILEHLAWNALNCVHLTLF